MVAGETWEGDDGRREVSIRVRAVGHEQKRR
jgi:hypothetical protein